ncbi:Protein JTB [Nymphon striatum]|nr:Protein JTB [Nymphon striatum]KAG1676495.1 Protein JTB [Nymphon striatum]
MVSYLFIWSKYVLGWQYSCQWTVELCWTRCITINRRSSDGDHRQCEVVSKVNALFDNWLYVSDLSLNESIRLRVPGNCGPLSIMISREQPNKPIMHLMPAVAVVKFSTLIIGITVLIVIFENHYTSENDAIRHRKKISSNNVTEKGCWLKEMFTIDEECIPCTQFQMASKHLPACNRTGFKEAGTCEKSGSFDRSCDKIPWVEERTFWTFEGVITIIGLLSSLVVKVRQKQLDKKFLERIQKQVAAGV